MTHEQHLLSQYKLTGKLELLGELYTPYMPLVYGLCFKYYKNQEQSEDAVMQIFESLILKLRTHEVNNFKSWLYTLARNHCLMEIRTVSKHSMVNIDESFMESDEFVHHDDEGISSEAKLSLMESCIDKLNDEQQRCIRLFYLEQKCYKEVVDLTGYDMNKVKSYIQNGKRNLKICMERHIEG